MIRGFWSISDTEQSRKQVYDAGFGSGEGQVPAASPSASLMSTLPPPGLHPAEFLPDEVITTKQHNNANLKFHFEVGGLQCREVDSWRPCISEARCFDKHPHQQSEYSECLWHSGIIHLHTYMSLRDQLLLHAL